MSLFGPPNIERLSAEKNVTGLTRALRYKKDREVRKAAAEALGEIGDARAVGPLITAVKDEHELVRQWGAWALGKIGDAQALEPLVSALKDESCFVRQWVAKALGKIGDARAVEPLITALGDEYFWTRQLAAEALGEIGDARAVEPLVTALKDEHKDVRVAAIQALGRIGDARAVEPLTTALEDEAQDVRKAATAVFSQRSWEPDCTVWVERLKSLPVTPPEKVPKSTHPNRASWDDDDRTDLASFARYLTDNCFRCSRNGGIAGSARGGGFNTSYEVYRTAESAWRVVETAEYYD